MVQEERALVERGLLPSKEEALQSYEQLVDSCPAPQLERKTFKALGTPIVQTSSLCSGKTNLSPEKNAAAGQLRREELGCAAR